MKTEDINTIQDCLTCLDYEYCAYNFEKCTGFIPKELMIKISASKAALETLYDR